MSEREGRERGAGKQPQLSSVSAQSQLSGVWGVVVVVVVVVGMLASSCVEIGKQHEKAAPTDCGKRKRECVCVISASHKQTQTCSPACSTASTTRSR